jgi:hypothetical protein
MNKTNFTMTLIRDEFPQTGTLGRLIIPTLKTYYTLEPIKTIMEKGCSLSGIAYNYEQKSMLIPTGSYNLTTMHISPKFKDIDPYNKYDGMVPRLLKVPERDGILIHIGNTVKDTSGCILVGCMTNNKNLSLSTRAYKEIFVFLHDLERKGNKLRINIIETPTLY